MSSLEAGRGGRAPAMPTDQIGCVGGSSPDTTTWFYSGIGVAPTRQRSSYRRLLDRGLWWCIIIQLLPELARCAYRLATTPAPSFSRGPRLNPWPTGAVPAVMGRAGRTAGCVLGSSCPRGRAARARREAVGPNASGFSDPSQLHAFPCLTNARGFAAAWAPTDGAMCRSVWPAGHRR